jgi:hypothetical protein
VDFCFRIGVEVFILGIKKHEFSHTELQGIEDAGGSTPATVSGLSQSDKGVNENDDT